MGWNRRTGTLGFIIVSVVILSIIVIAGIVCAEEATAVDFAVKNQLPSAGHLFGTDFMGRDMFVRTLAGLSMSIRLGLVTAAFSAVVALAVGVSSALLGKTADMVLGALIDLVMGIPHMLLLILISFACGRGFLGVVVGISLTHWTSLARLIRAEVIALRESPYIQIAGKLGAGKWEIARVHMLPHLVPQFVTGLILLFPHAILHEASITFLGFGLMPEQAAIGIILSESMGQLVMGKWWLALFPGLCLVAVVVMFQKLGQSVCDVLDPGRVHR